MKKILIFMAAMMLLQATTTAQRSDVTPKPLCRIPAEILESSGIAVSGSNLLWSHEDSGNDNKIFGFDTLGNLHRTITLSNATNVDWEDMATDDDGNLFVADLGNNNNTRTDLVIYKIPDPASISGPSVIAQRIELSFADQTAFPPAPAERNFDVEAMIWRSGRLYLFTKDRSNPFGGTTRMYSLDDQPGTYLLLPEATLQTGSDPDNDRVTSADYNRSTGELLLLTHNRLIAFTNYPDDHFFEGDKAEYFFSAEVGQNEGIGFVSSGKIYMTEEGEGGQGGWLYRLMLPQSTALSENTPHPGLFLSPVPASGILTIRCTLPDNTALTLSNSSGQILVRSTLGQYRSVDLGWLPAGTYALTLSSVNTILTRRFIKR